MNDMVRALIVDDEFVQIDGKSFKERVEITTFLQNLVVETPGIELLIEPSNWKFFRSITKVVYGSVFAGIKIENIYIKKEGEEIVSIMQLKAAGMDVTGPDLGGFSR